MTDNDTRSSERKQAIRAFGDDIGIVEKLRGDPDPDEDDEEEDTDA